MTTNTLRHKTEGYPVYGYETRNFFLLDLDDQVSLEDVKNKAFEIGEKYWLGDCLVVLSSDSYQLMLDLKPLQNYNLVYGRKIPFEYQQFVVKELRDSGKFGEDLRYVEFREQEKSSTLRVSPKSQKKGVGKPVAHIRITGENEGIKEYLKLLWVGRQIEKEIRVLEHGRKG